VYMYVCMYVCCATGTGASIKTPNRETKEERTQMIKWQGEKSVFRLSLMRADSVVWQRMSRLSWQPRKEDVIREYENSIGSNRVMGKSKRGVENTLNQKTESQETKSVT
jgi:hypothetical protein